MFEREELKDEETPDYHLHLFNIISLGSSIDLPLTPSLLSQFFISNE
jgi:hypothetical protein